MSILKINDADVHVIELNEAASETIVMIHGMFTNLSIFYSKIAPKLAERFHVVLYDYKGHGLSSVAASGYDFQSLSDDLLALLETLHLKKVHITGYSYGGLIALYTAMHHPETVNKMAVIEAPVPNDERPKKELEKYNRNLLEQYMQNLYLSTHVKPSARQTEKIYRQQNHLLNNTSFLEDLSKNRDFFSEIANANILHKTLLLYAKDSVCYNAGEMLHQYIRNSQLFIGEGDHHIPLQSPDWIAEKLYDFYSADLSL